MSDFFDNTNNETNGANETNETNETNENKTNGINNPGGPAENNFAGFAGNNGANTQNEPPVNQQTGAFENSTPPEQSRTDNSSVNPAFAEEAGNGAAADNARPEGAYTYSYTNSNLYGGGRTTVNPSGTNTNQNGNAGGNTSYGNGPKGYMPNQEHFQGTYSQNGYGYSYGGYNRQNPNNAQPQNGYYSAPPRQQYSQQSAPKPPKQKKKVTISAATAVIICISLVVLSLAGGILGATIVSKTPVENILNSGDEENHSVAGVDENGNVVLYRAVDTVKEDGSDMTLPEIANLVSDSVVEITTEYVSNDNFFGQYVNEGAGSGVIISSDGYIVTNNHVIYNSNTGKVADTINVRLRSGAEYGAKLIGRDADSDIAVIKIDATDLVAAVWGSSSGLVVGQNIIVVGNPLGELGGTVTNGIISATSREVEVENVKMTLIQTNAAVSPGNSGGGMFNEKGELVGIINSKSSGSGVEGLGFAIPSDDARDVVEQLLNYGYVKGKVFIGVSFYEANSGYYYSGDTGILYIYSVEKGYNDGVLQSKDILLSIDGEEVTTSSDVKAILKKHKVGDKLTFSIIRNKTAMDVEVTCYEYNPSDSSVSFNNDR